MYFQTRISYLKQIENGSVIKKAEDYIIEALSFTECEARLQSILEESIPEYDLLKAATTKLTDIILHDNAETFWKAKLSYVSYDEDSGREKKIQEYLLVQAEKPLEVIKIIEDRMEGSIVDWEIVSIQETGILDVFFYEEGKTEDKEDDKVES